VFFLDLVDQYSFTVLPRSKPSCFPFLVILDELQSFDFHQFDELCFVCNELILELPVFFALGLSDSGDFAEHHSFVHFFDIIDFFIHLLLGLW
jgi:hypothetical protein